MYVLGAVVLSSTPAAAHEAEAIVTEQSILPADAAVLSHRAPATFPLVAPVRLACRILPCPVSAAGNPALPKLDVSTTTKSFGSPVTNDGTVLVDKPGFVLVAVFIPVIPIQVTPLYSATFS